MCHNQKTSYNLGWKILSDKLILDLLFTTFLIYEPVFLGNNKLTKWRIIWLFIWEVSKLTFYNEYYFWTYNHIIHVLINFLSQAIFIWALNISWFIHSHICVLLCKSSQDNLSSDLIVLEMNYIQLKIIDVLGWFHSRPFQNYSVLVTSERLGEEKTPKSNFFYSDFFKPIPFLKKLFTNFTE